MINWHCHRESQGQKFVTRSVHFSLIECCSKEAKVRLVAFLPSAVWSGGLFRNTYINVSATHGVLAVPQNFVGG